MGLIAKLREYGIIKEREFEDGETVFMGSLNGTNDPQIQIARFSTGQVVGFNCFSGKYSIEIPETPYREREVKYLDPSEFSQRIPFPFGLVL